LPANPPEGAPSTAYPSDRRPPTTVQVYIREVVGSEGERDDAAVRPPGGGLRGVSQSPLLYHMIVHAKGEERPTHLTQHTDTIGNYNYRIRATSPR
jgi:hypothetical protein